MKLARQVGRQRQNGLDSHGLNEIGAAFDSVSDLFAKWAERTRSQVLSLESTIRCWFQPNNLVGIRRQPIPKRVPAQNGPQPPIAGYEQIRQAQDRPIGARPLEHEYR